VLVPEALPRRLRNSDILQNRTLLSLGSWTDGLELVPMAPAPRETAFAALGPLALARGATWLEKRGVTTARRLCAAVEGTAWVTRPIEADAVLGHGLCPVYAPWLKSAPPLVWGPGYDPTAPDRAARAAADRFLRRIAQARIVFVTNRASAEALRADLGLPPERVRVLPCFEPHLPRSDAAPLRDDDARELRVLFVGREARRKNLPRLVEAVKRLRAEGHAIVLTIVSDFRDGAVTIDTPATTIAELSQAEVLDAMRRHDLLCMPSIEESYGMVYIEALAAGMTVIAREGVVQRAMLEDGAMYADPASVEAIAAALRACSNPAIRTRQRDAGTTLYRLRYAPDVVAQAFEEALRAAVR
jgi:glycosyltransferase involved in cell wall biosynthesis